eukprot:15343707-Ditylum_brightwellii.AAC.1
MVKEVVEAIKAELDECNIGEGYNTTHLLEFFRVQPNKRRYLFESHPPHSWGDKLQGLLCDWATTKAILNGAILI